MADQITVIINKLEGFIDGIIRKLTLDIVANLVRAPSEGGTPVDTGWARANWVPSVGAPFRTDDDVNPKLRGPEAGGIGAVVGARAAEQQAGVAKVASSYTTDAGSAFISNNVPYIIKLNDGSSAQAPAGFVQAAIAKAITVDLPGGLRNV